MKRSIALALMLLASVSNAGSFVTGNTSLPSLKQDLYPPTGAATELTASDINGLWSAAGDLRSQLNQLVLENILPNTQWQIATAIGSSTKMAMQGTGTLAPITISGYTTGSNIVTATTSDTGQLKVGDLVMLQSPCDTNVRIFTERITAIVPNTSISFFLPFGLTASSSTSCSAIPTMAGGASSIGTGDAFDGWTKTTSAQVWRDDFSQNAKAGSQYSAGFKKGSAAAEFMYHTISKKDVGRYAGRTLVFGAWVYQKIKAGSGSWRAFISTNGTGGTQTSSTSATLASYEWREVSATIPADATVINLGVEFQGANGDVYYVSQPMAGFGSFLGTGNYRQPKTEILTPRVKYSPHINAAYNMPITPSAAANVTTVSGGGVGDDFGFKVDVYADSFAHIAPTTKKLLMQFEARNGSTTVNRSNALTSLKLKCSAGGTRGTAQFQVSSDGGSTYGTAITPGSGATTMQFTGAPWSSDANYTDVRYQVFAVGNGGTYGLNDTWTISTAGAVTFSGSGYNGITITPVTQKVALGIRDQVSPPIKYGLIAENKVANAQETQAGWVTLDDDGNMFIYTGTLGAAWYNASLDINGYEL